jgi:hypothetical protein
MQAGGENGEMSPLLLRQKAHGEMSPLALHDNADGNAPPRRETEALTQREVEEYWRNLSALRHKYGRFAQSYIATLDRLGVSGKASGRKVPEFVQGYLQIFVQLCADGELTAHIKPPRLNPRAQGLAQRAPDAVVRYQHPRSTNGSQACACSRRVRRLPLRCGIGAKSSARHRRVERFRGAFQNQEIFACAGNGPVACPTLPP